MVIVAADPIPAVGGRAEHTAIGLAYVFQPRDLSALRADAAFGRHFRPGRPSGGGRGDVGARICGVPATVGLDRSETAARAKWGARSAESRVGVATAHWVFGSPCATVRSSPFAATSRHPRFALVAPDRASRRLGDCPGRDR